MSDPNNDQIDDEIPAMPRWYHKKRYWILFFIFFTLGYFVVIQIPSRLQLSPETTGLAEPKLNADGGVDYFSELEKTYSDRLVPPEDNGYRDLLAACGPRILEQSPLMDAVPWQNLQNDPNGRNYFANYWIPLCEKLEIDPFPRPKYLDSLCISTVAKKLELESRTLPDGTVDENRPEISWTDYMDRLMDAPWGEEDFPEAAKWLAERNPVLDLFGECVRKPNFVCPRIEPADGSIIAILLPDIQSLRAFVRDLKVRIAFRINAGEIDEAWDDVMSMLLLSRNHMMKEPIMVTILVGFAVEGIAFESVRMILESNQVPPEQLERFAADLNSLPPASIPEICFITEKNMLFSFMHAVIQAPLGDKDEFFLANNPTFQNPDVNTCLYLPIDPNIAGRTLSGILEEVGYPGDGKTVLFEEDTREARKELAAKSEAAYFKSWDIVENKFRYGQLLSLRARSELFAHMFFATHAPSPASFLNSSDMAEMKMRLGKTAIAVERFELANGKLPDDLAELSPEFLSEQPNDYFSANNEKTIIYKPAPDEETLYLLYSRGRDMVDNGGEGDDIAWKRRK